MSDRTGQMAKRRIMVGVVTGAHGVRGLVRVKSFTTEPAGLIAYGPLTDADGVVSYGLAVKGMVKGQVLAAVTGCTDRRAADALRGAELYLERDLLPEPEDEDEFYHADLIGLAAVAADGMALGTVRAVFDFGSGDMLEVTDADCAATFYPFTRDVVPEIDPAAGTLTVLPPAEASAWERRKT